MMPIPRGTPELVDFEASWLYMLPEDKPTDPEEAARVSECSHRRVFSAEDCRLSFRYGPIAPDTPFGGDLSEFKTSEDGLSVSISDGPPPLVTEVRYMGTTLVSRAVGAPLPRAEWMRIHVICSNSTLTIKFYAFSNDQQRIIDYVPNNEPIPTAEELLEMERSEDWERTRQ